jgi:hypothetical protein
MNFIMSSRTMFLNLRKAHESGLSLSNLLFLFLKLGLQALSLAADLLFDLLDGLELMFFNRLPNLAFEENLALGDFGGIY